MIHGDHHQPFPLCRNRISSRCVVSSSSGIKRRAEAYLQSLRAQADAPPTRWRVMLRFLSDTCSREQNPIFPSDRGHRIHSASSQRQPYSDGQDSDRASRATGGGRGLFALRCACADQRSDRCRGGQLLLRGARASWPRLTGIPRL